MPTDFSSREPPSPVPSGDAPLFAATPVWERGNKRKGLGFGGRKHRKVAAEPRAFAPPPQPAAAAPAATVTNSTFAAQPEPAPVRRERVSTARARGAGASNGMLLGVSAAALVVALGFGAWFLTRPHDGVPELSSEPAGEATTVAATPMPPVIDTPTEVAAAEPVRAQASPAPTTRAAPTARVRPVQPSAPAATANGANASAVLPDGPQPYSTLNPTAEAPPPVQAAPPPVLPIPPATQAPVPADPVPEAAPLQQEPPTS